MIKYGGGASAGIVLSFDMLEPVGFTKGQFIFRFDTFRGKPICTFPSKLITETRTVLFKTMIDWADSKRPTGRRFLVGPMNGVMRCLALERTFKDLIARIMEFGEPSDIGSP